MIISQPSVPSDKQSSSTPSLATPLSCLTLIGRSAQHRCNHKLVSLPISQLLYLVYLQLFFHLLTPYKLSDE